MHVLLVAQEEVTSVCVAHDRDGTPLVVILDAVAKRLVALRVESDDRGVPTSAGEAFRLDATASAPMAATRHMSGLGAPLLDLLVLRPSGRLELFVGQEHVCTCDFPLLPPAPTPDVATTGGSSGMDMALTPVAKARSVVDPRTPRTAGSDAMDMDMELTPLSSAPVPPAASPAALRQATPAATPPPHVAATPLRTTDIVGLVDACGPRVNALMADGSRFRCGLHMRFTTQPHMLTHAHHLQAEPASCAPVAPCGRRAGRAPARAAAGVVQHVGARILPVAGGHWCARLLCVHPIDNIASPTHPSLRKPGDSPDDAWHALSSLLLRMLGVPASESAMPAPLDSGGPWEGLLASGLHERCAPGLPAILASVGRSNRPGGCAVWPSGPGAAASDAGSLALDALHSLYEDCKLDCMRHTHLQPLAQLATRVAAWTGDTAYVEHYQRDWGASCVGTAAPRASSPPARQPPDTLRALHALLATGSTDAMDALLPRALLQAADPGARGPPPPHVAWSAAVCRAFRALGTHGPVGVPPACADGGLDSTALARLPVGVALVLQEALAQVRPTPPDGWPPAAYILIGRPDCASAATGSRAGEAPGRRGPQSQLSTLLRALSLDSHAAADSGHDGAGGMPRDGGDGDSGGVAAIDDADGVPDGMDDLAVAVGPLRFGRDARVLDVRRLLCSAKPVPLTHGDGGEGGELEAAPGGSQPRLWALANRTCALPLGRGAFTLGTWHPLPASTLPVPGLCLAGRLMASHNATIQLDLTAPGAPVNFTCWPEFHNGCAAGLRFAGGDVTPPLTRSWILHSRPKEHSNQQAGVLLALGLAGHLTALGQAEQFGYLEGEHSPTTCALLLGLAASAAASSHGPTSRTLFLHLPSKHPASFPELELPHTVQAAALIGIGILYRGTAHRAMVDALLSELRRASSGPEVASDGREGHALAAGLALGTVLLGHGRAGSAHIADLCVDTHLVSLMRYDASVAAAAAATTSGSPGERGSASGAPSTDALAILPVLRSLNGDMAVPNPYARGGGLFLPGAGVNLGVTGPGAALALGLWFLRTGDVAVASQFQVPASLTALDDVRPEQLLLRIVARALVMWDDVEGSAAWVDAQLPPFLAAALEAQPGGQQQPGDDPTLGNGPQDRESMATAAAYIRAGACLSLGLRFAGTCDAGAASELRRHVLLFMELKRAKGPASGAVAIDKHALETCLCCAALSLACVLAGSGHLDTLRLLRLLRRRVEQSHHGPGGGGGSITYGSHMAISLAIGLLFLGGGTHTLSTSPSATAALLTAIVPPFPASPTDNRGHLQALRHLYVLAAVRRDVRAVDADTRAPCYAPVELSYQDGATHHTCAPCCAPRAQEVTQMRVLGPRYWPLTIQGPHLRAVLRGEAALLVKRRPGCLPYQDDPRGTRSLLSRALAVEDTSLLTAHQAGSPLRAACAAGGDLATDALAACVSGAAEDALPAHVSLYSTASALHSAVVPRDAPLCVAMHNLRLCSTLYTGALWATRISGGRNHPPLMRHSFAEACRQRSAAALERHVTEGQLRAYVAGQGVQGPMLGAFLLLHGVPHRDAALVHGLPVALGAATLRSEESLPLPHALLRGLINVQLP
jgi:hypothetical protein